MKNKYKYILSTSVLIIGLLITVSIVLGDVKDTCEDKESASIEQTHSIEAHDEENEPCNSSVPGMSKSSRITPVMLIVPCAIALVVILFFILKVLYRIIREKLE